MKKRVLFITGTRADYGKLKSLIRGVHGDAGFEYEVFATGMHMLSKYGNTVLEITRAGFSNLFMYINQMEGDGMEVALANTVTGLTRYLSEHPTDLIVIHGDRIEALAGAITGALRNIRVAHVEGGEVSGTIDELLRHATSKLSHIHFVANGAAKKRLLQLGENEDAVFEIGSPDIDIMFSNNLPSLPEAKAHYGIIFDRYAILLLHPVTTELTEQYQHARTTAEALVESQQSCIAIYPNNDVGADSILRGYREVFAGCQTVKLFPSLRFEYFLTLLKHADFLIGNSSAGVHEAPVYGVPTINIGTRQQNRFDHESIFHVDFDKQQLLELIRKMRSLPRFSRCMHYGKGQSAAEFLAVLKSPAFWRLPLQKQFCDRPVLEGVSSCVS